MLDLQPIPQSGKNFTVSLAAWLLAFFNDESLWQEAYLQNFKAGIEQSCQQYHLTPPTPPQTQTKKDPRCEQIKEVQQPAVIKIYTDYDLCKALPFNSPYFEFVDDQNQADFLLIFKQVKDFLNIPIRQKICQFPYESCLIRKVISNISDLFMSILLKYLLTSNLGSSSFNSSSILFKKWQNTKLVASLL